MNGSVMPLVGIRCSVEAMLTKACRPKLATSPAAASTTNRSASASSRSSPRSTMKANSADDHQAQDHAELLAGHREHEVGMGVGQHVLHPALAGAAAEQPAVAERFQRARHLIVVARAGSRKRVDAAVHMREEGDRRPRRAAGHAARPMPTSTRFSPPMNNCAKNTPEITASMPTSGCDFSSSAITA